MDRFGQKGSITVFLSLVCILFLSLICASVESARFQGARAQTVNIAGMSTFSLLGEFEKTLLEKYNIFSLDGTYGNGAFGAEKVKERLEDYISYHVQPDKGLNVPFVFDPWNLELTDSSIEEYALLTDDKGEPFYQQAVSYMKVNAAGMAVDKLLEYTKHQEEIETWQEKYEESRKSNDSQITELEGSKQQKLQEMESEAAERGTVFIEPEEPKGNPLKEIASLRKKSTLSIVTWDKELSAKKINPGNFPSGNRNRRGTMKIEKTHSGLTANLLFREYLLQHFPSYLSGLKGKALDYQIEYILGGKNTDEKNLKYVVNRLLLIREGMNYLYCLKDQSIRQQAEKLAVALTGFFGIPALTAATKHALLLAWAYGESLVDVRILLDGGKVPIWKDASTWSLTLENLGRITEILKEGAKESGKGLMYPEYLRVLLNMGSVSSQKMRALDMIQAELREEGESSGFKAENCIVAVKTNTQWKCRTVFFSLPKAVMGISGPDSVFTQKCSIAY